MSPSIIFHLITGIFIFIGFQYLTIALVSKEYKLNLYYGLFVLCMAGNEYFDYARAYSVSLNDFSLYAKYQAGFYQLGCIFNIIFISEYANIRLKKMEFFILATVGILLILNFYQPCTFVYSEIPFFQMKTNENHEIIPMIESRLSVWMLLWTFQLVMVNVYVLIGLVKRYKKLHENATGWLILISILVFLSMLNDELVILPVIKLKLHHFAILLLILLMTYIFLKNYLEAVGLDEKLSLQIQMRKNKEELTHMIVHDLKNPLNILLNLSADESKEIIVEKIKSVTTKMQYQIQDIMDVYRSEKTGLRINLDNCSLTNLVESAYENVRFFIHMKDIEFIFESENDYIVLADRNHIERVLINLVSNAIKYTTKHGLIKIIITEKENMRVVIKVQDNGIGIPKEKLGNAFRKFETINKPDNSVIQSTGLGLSYCKLAIESHQSNIIIESEEGKGTSVSFCLRFIACREQDSTVIRFENQLVSNTLHLKKADKEYILNKYPELLTYEIHEITHLRKIIKILEKDDLINRFWLGELKKSVLIFDESLFKGLLK